MFTQITISVRNLVEFLLRSGDLDNRTAGGGEDAMLEGARIHRMLQKEAGPDYQAEVSLRLSWTFNRSLPEKETEYAPVSYGQRAGDAASRQDVPHEQFLDHALVVVEGRADGIYFGGVPGEDIPDAWTIDEIKTTFRKLKKIRTPEPVHLAQAKCYAYMYAVQNGLERVHVRMTYYSQIDGSIRHFYEQYTFEALHEWFMMLMEEYRKWAEYSFMWQIRRTASARQIQFPYPYRDGQRDLAAGVYRTILRERKLFLEAPTGTGKTLTTIFPSVKAMGEGKAERIFYLTAKTIARTAAEQAVEVLRGKGLLCKSVVLTAREKICPLEKPSCNPDDCPRARGHYDRVNDAMFELLTGSDNFSREALEACAERHEVCPFELGLDMSLFSDIIIGDYNYLFDPHAYLRRFFGEGDSKGNYIFLVDEAHNLVDRGRNMYSAEIYKEEILEIRRRCSQLYPSLDKKLKKCNKAMLDIKKTTDGCTKRDDISPAVDTLYALEAELTDIFARERLNDHTGQNRKDPLYKAKKAVRDELLEFYFKVNHFLLIYELVDDHYVIYSETGEDGRTMLRLFCMDPGKNLAHCMARGRASILFSATFLPIQYYKSLLGGSPEDYEIYAKSVFDRNRRALLVVDDVTSRYTRRSAEEFERIADCIHAVTGQRHGNYMIFFPSYAFMQQVADIFEEKYLGILPEKHMPVPLGRRKSAWMEDTFIIDEEDDTALAEADLHPVPDPKDHTVPGAEITCIRQHSRMDEKEREAFLDRFSTIRNDQSLLGFCVLGGIFSEGIDLKNDALIGALVVGTGLPMVCSERELLKEYFNGRGEDGYDYAYRYPGMNKVLQAAGRVIRTAEDTGIVVLMDERFNTSRYRRLFPQEWSNCRVTDSRGAGRIIEKFWDEWLR